MNSASPDLDLFLGGGYSPGVLTTIFGPAGSGKSNIVHMLCASAAGKVLFIDTEGSFSPDRLRQLGATEKTLEKIMVLRPRTFAEQERGILSVDELSGKISAVVVDSLTSLYRAELESEIAQMNKSLVAQMRTLIEFSKRTDAIILVTARVYADMETKDGVKIAGGMMVKNHSKILIELKKSGRNRIAVMLKNPDAKLVGTTMLFRITKEGIEKISK